MALEPTATTPSELQSSRNSLATPNELPRRFINVDRCPEKIPELAPRHERKLIVVNEEWW